ncbi:MAG: hypothetical protein AAF203_03970 [Pseudomonadota bacterium]
MFRALFIACRLRQRLKGNARTAHALTAVSSPFYIVPNTIPHRQVLAEWHMLVEAAKTPSAYSTQIL